MLRLLVGDEKRSMYSPQRGIHWYNKLVMLKSTSHAVYEAKYHLVWCPKYRKRILVGQIRERVRELFFEIAERFDFEIDRCEVVEDHIHMLISFPPRYSIAKVVGIIKGISGSKIFEEYPKLKKKLWGGHLWEQGYFVRTVGEQITDDVIRRYIEKHSFSSEQLKFEDI